MSRALRLALVAALAAVGGCDAEPAGADLSPLHGVIFINELVAANDSTRADEAGDYDDWIELYNAGSRAVNLGALYLTDNLDRPLKWNFPNVSVPAGGYLLVWADGETSEGALHASFKLNADPGEQVGIYSSDGNRLLLVDTVTFGRQGKDTAWGRLPDGGEDWCELPVATPGEQNTSNLSPLRGRLFINEFMAANTLTIADEAGDYDDWIELYNAGPEAVDLGGLYLTDDLGVPKKWAVPNGSLPAGGYLLVWADNESGEGPFHASFNLGAATGEQLGLFAGYGRHVLLIDTLSFGHQGADTSQGRLPDGTDNWQLMTRPTPGSANRGGR